MTANYTTTTSKGYGVRDQSCASNNALSNGAGTTNGNAIDLGPLTGISARTERMEALLTAPALNATQLPNTTTVTYALQSSNTSNFASNTVLVAACITQTGNAGAATTSYRYKLPSDCKRYLRAVAVGANVGNANVGDCSASYMKLDLLF